MDFRIEKIDLNNYSLFDDMVFWRANGFERESSQMPVSEQMKKELANPNLHQISVAGDLQKH